MKNVLFMRHAKSSWENGELEDHERPLNSRGKRDAPAMARFLKEQYTIPEQIFCSPAQRTRQTCQLICRELNLPDDIIRYEPSLYFEGSDAYLQSIREASEAAETLLVIGHNPMTEQVIRALAGASFRDTVSTAAAACFRTEAETWSKVVPDQLHFAWFMKPKSLSA
ncbi:MAG: SixA phosphatase family protein [Balneolaceae bacterium]